nr:heat shock 70 kDa protein-like [Biomphalaria glabrata]
MLSSSRSPAIGIDLGTTCSSVAVFLNDKVQIIANEQGCRSTPSSVAFTDTEVLVGEAAKSQESRNPANTISDSKRIIGRNFDNRLLQNDLKTWPFSVLEKKGKPMILVNYLNQSKLFAPEEISSMILGKMKQVAEAYLGMPVNDAVVTVPAYFNDSQRQATIDAGSIAGLNILRIINEPTAAALAYGLDKAPEGEKNILIFDLGGGTFDVSILTINKGSSFEVKASAGDTHLGGEDFNLCLLSHFVKEFHRKSGVDIGRNQRALQRLKAECERVKKCLSVSAEARLEVDSLFQGIDFTSRITRSRFEEICKEQFKAIMDPVKVVLQDAFLTKEEIHEILLVGGSTRIPKVQAMLTQFFDGKELNKSINPDEAVAVGAAVQAAVISGVTSKCIKDIHLVDLSPLSLGIETADGAMTVLVKRGTPLPYTTSSVFTTHYDYQTAVTVQIFEGERSMATDNELLGVFELRDIPPAPRGVPKITVTLELDDNGILKVGAEDKVAGKSSNISITANKNRLCRSAVKKLIAESKRHRLDDETMRALASSRNELESLVYKTQRAMQSAGILLSLENRLLVDKVCNETVLWLEANRDAAMEELEAQRDRLQSVGEELMRLHEEECGDPACRPWLSTSEEEEESVSHASRGQM